MTLIVLDGVASIDDGAPYQPTSEEHGTGPPGCGDRQQQRVRGVSLRVISSPTTLRRLPN
jgi:hypothetical protein